MNKRILKLAKKYKAVVLYYLNLEPSSKFWSRELDLVEKVIEELLNE